MKQNDKDYRIDRIISSDLKRALETAKYVGDSLQLPVEQSKDWRETNNGVLAGMPDDEADRKYPGLYFNSLGMNERYPGGESPSENFTRIHKAFQDLCEEQIDNNHQENILVVTHGGVINIIYHILKEIEWTNKNKFFPAANTSIHQIELVKGEWKITQENKVDHLR